LTLKNIVTLKSRLGGHSPCEFMHDLYIAEIYRLGAMFLRWHCGNHWCLQSSFGKKAEYGKVVRCSRSRSFKV